MSDEQLDFAVSDEDRKEIEEAIEKYNQQAAGLPEWKKIEAPEYLYINIESLRKKTPEELAEACFELNQYAVNIQRIINRNKAWERWAKLKIEEVASNNLDKLGNSYGWNERMTVCKNMHPLCRKLNHFMLQISMRLDNLYDLPNQIRSMSESIKDVKFAALRREKDYSQ